MKESCKHSNPLKREGTTQSGRVQSALDPKRVVLHELKPGDWLKFAFDYAEQINYFAAENAQEPSGNWQQFFDRQEELADFVNDYTEGNADPFFGLFISFLKLLNYPQKSLNDIPERHLDYYYKEVLKIKEKSFVPDKVHVLFELAKNADSAFIDGGILLDAGEDDEGNSRKYEITHPFVVNHATIGSIRGIHAINGELRYAYNAKHPQGIDEDADEGVSWQAFGNDEWPKADIGVYIASHVLKLKEGKRFVTVELEIDNPPDSLPISGVSVHFTGEDDWLSSSIEEAPQLVGKKIQFKVKLDADEDAVSSYAEEKHNDGLSASLPVMRVIFTGVGAYEALSSIVLKKVAIEVRVEGVKSLQLQNKQGTIDPENPFMPFGSIPKPGSRFIIRCEELNDKPLKDVEFHLNWLNHPSNFSDYYKHYTRNSSSTVSTPHQFDSQRNVPQRNIPRHARMISSQDSSFSSYGRFVRPHNPVMITDNIQIHSARMLDDFYRLNFFANDVLRTRFTMQVKSPYKSSHGSFRMFGAGAETPKERDIQLNGLNNESARNGHFEFELESSFFHESYNKIYVAEILKASSLGNNEISPDLLPNKPYTPLLDELRMSYTSKVELDVSDNNHSENEAHLTLFYKHPFGVEQVKEGSPRLVPVYNQQYLYIGIDKLEAGSNVRLLFQVDEGSENPEATSEFPIDWHVLSGSQWHALSGEQLIYDNTNNFLRSGIVELQIPNHIAPAHLLFEADFIWIRITLKNAADSVPRFVDVHTQAGEAIFLDANNDRQHLNNGLPENTIDQLHFRRSSVKSVSQPYASFGGERSETAPDFYRRVSERLRHKDRAVSIWDYEHLILEAFPGIHKVKCLNHTLKDERSLIEHSPGNVTVVLIPKLSALSGTHRMEPKVGSDLISRVQSFLARRSSPHVNHCVCNPLYEKVSFHFRVKFKNGLDFNHHKGRIQDDLLRWLTPWAFDASEDILFEGSVYLYDVIHFLEKLEYVDFVEDLNMYHESVDGDLVKKNEISPGTPMTILVSGKHDVKPVTSC